MITSASVIAFGFRNNDWELRGFSVCHAFAGILEVAVRLKGDLPSGITFKMMVERICLPDQSCVGFKMAGGRSLILAV